MFIKSLNFEKPGFILVQGNKKYFSENIYLMMILSKLSQREIDNFELKWQPSNGSKETEYLHFNSGKLEIGIDGESIINVEAFKLLSSEEELYLLIPQSKSLQDYHPNNLMIDFLKYNTIGPSSSGFSFLIEEGVDGFIVISAETSTILYSNQVAQDILERSDRELLGTKFAYPISKTHTNIEIITPSNNVKHVEMRSKTTTWQNTKVIQITLRDRTHVNVLEQNLMNAERKILQSNKMEALGKMAGQLAHNINNSLMVILGHVNIIESDIGNSPHLNKIKQQVMNTTEITDQLLKLSSSDIVKFEVIDFNNTIRSLQPMLEPLVGNNTTLSFDISSSNSKIFANKNQIEQILINLIKNASEAIEEEGEIIIKTEVIDVITENYPEFGLIKDGKYVKLEVIDSGSGILEENRNHIFEPFFTTKGELGHGLGLSSIYGIVHQMKGVIDFHSEPGDTAFIIYLPLWGNK